MFTLLYADDTILKSESPENLQSMLNSLHVYCENWKLQVNTSKTKIMKFSKGNLRKTPKQYFGNNQLEVVQDYIYFGVIFNYNGSFTKAINKQVAQAKRAMYGLMVKNCRLHLLVDLQLHLFDTYIAPILLYGCEIWGFANINAVEIVHNQYCKQILKLHKNTVNCMTHGKLDHLKLEKTIKERVLNFWTRLETGKVSKISYCLYVHR